MKINCSIEERNTLARAINNYERGRIVHAMDELVQTLKVAEFELPKPVGSLKGQPRVDYELKAVPMPNSNKLLIISGALPYLRIAASIVERGTGKGLAFNLVLESGLNQRDLWDEHEIISQAVQCLGGKLDAPDNMVVLYVETSSSTDEDLQKANVFKGFRPDYGVYTCNGGSRDVCYASLIYHPEDVKSKPQQPSLTTAVKTAMETNVNKTVKFGHKDGVWYVRIGDNQFEFASISQACEFLAIVKGY